VQVIQQDYSQIILYTISSSHLNNLIQEPGHRLQLELGDVVGDGLQEGAKVRVGKLHAGEEI